VSDDAPRDPHVETADVVLRFLESVGRPAEAKFYLDLFRSLPPEQFAVVAVDSNVMRDAEDAVALDLRFLASLGLRPTVLLGLLQPHGAKALAKRLAGRLEAAGVRAEIVPCSDPAHAERVAEAARAGIVPVAWMDGGDAETTPARFDVLAALLSRLLARKLIFLHRPGGLRVRGAIVPLVNLSTDVEALLASRDLSRKEAMLVAESRRLVLERVTHRLVVSVSSPLELLGELFTVRGTGTLLRRGAEIVRHDGWEGVDAARLRDLLVASFGRAPRDGFFEVPVSAIYREESWRGAAVLRALPLGSYLTKFAVSPEAQGEGLARDLWEAFAAEHPVVLWRAREGNPIVDWYSRLADGLVRVPGWHVFWRGVALADVPAVVESVLAQPVDMPG
jgi:acetylglutamate kinase